MCCFSPLDWHCQGRTTESSWFLKYLYSHEEPCLFGFSLKMNLCSEWTSLLPGHLKFDSDLHDCVKHVVCRLETHKKTSVRWL